jgi:hypothetical protein
MKQKKGWRKESQRHQLASHGIKTDLKAKGYISNKINNWAENKQNNAIISISKWKNEYAKQLALDYVNAKAWLPKGNFNKEVGFGGLHPYKDSFNNKWSQITVYDKSDKPLEFLKLIIIPMITRKKNFNVLNNIEGVEWEVIKNPLKVSSHLGDNKRTYISYATLIGPNIQLITEGDLKIYISGNSEKEINEINKQVDNKIRNLFYFKREQIRYD